MQEPLYADRVAPLRGKKFWARVYAYSGIDIVTIYLKSSESSSATIEKGALGVSFCRLHATIACAPTDAA